MASQFPHLFSPIQIGNMTVRNRIVNTAHGTNFARDRMVTDRHIFYHVERAKGGVGMSIMEATSVHPRSRNPPANSVVVSANLTLGLVNCIFDQNLVELRHNCE